MSAPCTSDTCNEADAVCAECWDAIFDAGFAVAIERAASIYDQLAADINREGPDPTISRAENARRKSMRQATWAHHARRIRTIAREEGAS